MHCTTTTSTAETETEREQQRFVDQIVEELRLDSAVNLLAPTSPLPAPASLRLRLPTPQCFRLAASRASQPNSAPNESPASSREPQLRSSPMAQSTLGPSGHVDARPSLPSSVTKRSGRAKPQSSRPPVPPSQLGLSTASRPVPVTVAARRSACATRSAPTSTTQTTPCQSSTVSGDPQTVPVLQMNHHSASSNLNSLIIQTVLLPNEFVGLSIFNLILDIFDRFISHHIHSPNPAHTHILVFIIRSTLSNNIQQILLPLDHMYLTPDEILAITVYSFSSIGVSFL